MALLWKKTKKGDAGEKLAWGALGAAVVAAAYALAVQAYEKLTRARTGATYKRGIEKSLTPPGGRDVLERYDKRPGR